MKIDENEDEDKEAELEEEGGEEKNEKEKFIFFCSHQNKGFFGKLFVLLMHICIPYIDIYLCPFITFLLHKI